MKYTKNSPIRILIQNRPYYMKYPGGDSVVIQKLMTFLEKEGMQVDINADPQCDLSAYHLVHAFNFVLTNGLQDAFAKNAYRQGVSFFVTSLQEDAPRFQNQSYFLVEIFKKYIECGQNEEVFIKGMQIMPEVPAAALLTAPYAAMIANQILTCGSRESALIKKLYPEARVHAIPFGANFSEIEIGPEAFINHFGVQDFILCVGRLEARKNQLMLLKALEDDDLPVVLADGGFTYQQDYAELCRKFRRKGATLVTGRLSKELLVSAYKAARMHCLPSWYELPGLVSLEAAWYGCEVVASSWGALKDYLGDNCYYCVPTDPQSIRSAIYHAIENPKRELSQQAVQQFSWEKFGEGNLANYYKILNTSAQELALLSDIKY